VFHDLGLEPYRQAELEMHELAAISQRLSVVKGKAIIFSQCAVIIRH
jgi:hypothetical protein